MSDCGIIQWVAVAAIIAALGMPARGADLLPPSPPRHRAHAPPRNLPLPLPDHMPLAAPAGDLPRVQTGEHAGATITGWGANSTNDGASVRFLTDPSGVIDGTQFDPKYQFSPNWLKGTERER